MKIKTLILFIIICTFSLGLISCDFAMPRVNDRLAELNGSDDDKVADTRFQKIIEAIENKDKEGLKKVFSPNALKEAKDIDGGINYVMELYKGKMKSKDRALSRSDLNNDGKKISELKVSYTVTTDEDTYIVFFIDKIVDTKNPDSVGIYMLQIIKESDRKKEFDGGGEKTRCAGIYRPNSSK